MAPEARVATPDDVGGMGEALALAFHDDPAMKWLFGHHPTRAAPHLRKYMRHEAARHLRNPTVFTLDGHPGAAVWDPPGAWKTGLRDILGLVPVAIPGINRRIVRALRGLAKMERTHDRQPEHHYYLAILGTRPDRQGQGVGSALMRPVLERCDAEGVGAYLESSKASNIPFYRRHGFEVVEELRLPGGPVIYPMWRDPQG